MCVCMFACGGHMSSGVFLSCPPPLNLRQEPSLNSDLGDPSQCRWDALSVPLECWWYRRLLPLPSLHKGSQDPARRLVCDKCVVHLVISSAWNCLYLCLSFLICQVGRITLASLIVEI